jgi:uncharacterized protein involved in exopolysaccharide biosynthesis
LNVQWLRVPLTLPFQNTVHWASSLHRVLHWKGKWNPDYTEGNRIMNKMLGHISAASLPLRTYYEDAVFAKVANLWRRKVLILTTVAVALLLGVLVSVLLPTRYTADAFVRVGFTSSDTASGNNGGSIISVDASALVETHSRVFKTHQLARRVVESLGFERLGAEAGQGRLPSWLQVFFGGGVQSPGYREDFAAAKLLRSLTVKTDPRAYLITVSYSAGNPELAALIANAFVTESLKVYALQRLNEQRASAQAALSDLITTLGERHPSVTRARVKLAGVEAQLEAEKLNSKSAASGSVMAAQAIAVPSSPNPQLLVGIALLVGLIAGIVIAVVLDRLDKPLPSGKMARAGRGQAGDNATASARPPPATNGAEVAARSAAVRQSE